MLVQLLPDQVARYWEQVSYSVEAAFPPTSKELHVKSLLEALLSGKMVAWVSVDDETKGIVAIITTTITEDVCSGSKNLLLYSIYGLVEKIGKKNWHDGFETLKKYAKAKGCSRVVAYTQQEAIKKLAKWFGGDASYSLITLDID